MSKLKINLAPYVPGLITVVTVNEVSILVHTTATAEGWSLLLGTVLHVVLSTLLISGTVDAWQRYFRRTR